MSLEYQNLSELKIINRFMNINLLHKHEKIFYDLLENIEYNHDLFPSLIVCEKSKLLIDGHHRYEYLRKQKIENVPVTLIDYLDERIIINNIKNNLRESKLEIIQNSKNGNLLNPKSTNHYIKNNKINFHVSKLSIPFKIS